MKELTIEEKAKAYDEVVENGKQILNTPYTAHWDIMKEVVEHLIPELKESDDEKIRKALIEGFKVMKNGSYGECTFSNYNIPVTDIIACLEKQGGQKPAYSRQETKPNGGIVCEDFNEGDGYYKVNLAYLSKSQVELIENLVASWHY